MFGILDIFVALIVLLFMTDIIGLRLIISASLYLILKAIIFFGDGMSMFDGFLGFVILLNVIINVGWIYYLIIAYLVIKGGTSLL
jgi:hypothetical protein